MKAQTSSILCVSLRCGLTLNPAAAMAFSSSMSVEIGAAVLEQNVGEIVETALGGDAWLQLADSAGRGVTRIGELGEAFLLAFVIHLLECRQRHEQFAAYFEVLRNTRLFQLSFGMESGMERTVRTFKVTSSPVVPSPRVMPRTSLPSS